MVKTSLVYCFLLGILSGCGPQEPDEPVHGQCPDQMVFGMGVEAPWIPSWTTIHQHASLHKFFKVPVLIGVSQSEYACEPEQWLPAESLALDKLGQTILFLCAGSGTDCEGQFRRHHFEVVSAYEPPADTQGTSAIAISDERIVSWRAVVEELMQGEYVDEPFQNPSMEIGAPGTTTSDVLVLGKGGVSTFRVCRGIRNGDGVDFAVFENGVNDTFLELAFVEVSSDGIHFLRFPNAYLGMVPVGPYEGHESALIRGLAGQFRFGFGTGFDLALLSDHPDVTDGRIDLDDITFVRLVDIVGDGATQDSFQNPILDPYPTRGSAGFDLIGIGVISETGTARCGL